MWPLLLLPSVALATDYNITFCVEITTNFTDLGGDYWSSNSPRKARGVHLRVERVGPGTLEWDTYTNNQGCKTLTLSDSWDYEVMTKSTAQVNGVDVEVFDDTTTPQNYSWVHFHSSNLFDPAASSGSETLTIPAVKASGALAVGTSMMYHNNMGLGASTPLTFINDTCCQYTRSDHTIHASAWSKTVISHEVGHAVSHAREGYNNANTDYGAPLTGCDGEWSAVRREYQSTAAHEGFAELISAWTWNDTTESDCDYDVSPFADFDLDGTLDNSEELGLVNCEGIPEPNLAAFVTSKDWLENVKGGVSACTGSLNSFGTYYDWQRYGWDMLSDEGLTIDELVDIYDDANPQSWDADDNSVGSDGSVLQSDDVIVRWATAADTNGFLTEHNNQKTNGQDH